MQCTYCDINGRCGCEIWMNTRPYVDYPVHYWYRTSTCIYLTCTGGLHRTYCMNRRVRSRYSYWIAEYVPVRYKYHSVRYWYSYCVYREGFRYRYYWVYTCIYWYWVDKETAVKILDIMRNTVAYRISAYRYTCIYPDICTQYNMHTCTVRTGAYFKGIYGKVPVLVQYVYYTTPGRQLQ